MENVDASGLFSLEMNSVFKKAKKLIYFSSPVGLVIGVVAGISDDQLILGALVGAIIGPVLITGAILFYLIFWFPSIVAKGRGHAYTSLIQILNIAGLFTGVTWFIAAAWAIFPSEKSLIDPIVGNVTGLGRRNAGDTIGSAKHGSGRGASFESDTDAQIDKLIDMHTKGLVSDEEFARKKIEILQRNY
jgi:hypothetical protein